MKTVYLIFNVKKYYDRVGRVDVNIIYINKKRVLKQVYTVDQGVTTCAEQTFTLEGTNQKKTYLIWSNQGLVL